MHKNILRILLIFFLSCAGTINADTRLGNFINNELIMSSEGIMRDKQGRMIDGVMITYSSKFEDDHPFAREIIRPGDRFIKFDDGGFPDNNMIVKLNDKGTGQVSFSELGSNLRRKAGTERTYESDTFSSIMFIRNSEAYERGQDQYEVYFVPVTHTESGKMYMLMAYVNAFKRDFIELDDADDLRNLYLLATEGAMTRDFAELAASDFDGLVERYHKGSRFALNLHILSDDIHYDGVVIASESGIEALEAGTREFNDNIPGSPDNFNFSGTEDDFEKQILPFINSQVLDPICNEFLGRINAALGGVIASTYWGDDRCGFQSAFGEMEILVHNITRSDCRNGKCNFGFQLDCTARGAPVLETCGNFKDDVFRRWGPEGTIFGVSELNNRGYIENAKVDF